MGAKDDHGRAPTAVEPSLVAWEPPRVVRLNALPDVLGDCLSGGTHFAQGANCRNGTSPKQHCRTGYGIA